MLAQTDPRSIYLLDDPKSFSSRETTHLFGQRFLDTLLKEADQDEKLSRRSRLGLSSAAAGSASRVRTKRGASSGQRGRSSRGRRYEPILSRYPPSLLDLEIGGRLRFFLDAWSSLSNDFWILETISKGLELEFITQPFQRSLPCAVRMTEAMSLVCEEEVRNLV